MPPVHAPGLWYSNRLGADDKKGNDMRRRVLAAAIVIAAGFAAFGAEAQQGNTINVVVSGIKDNVGSIRCVLPSYAYVTVMVADAVPVFDCATT